MHPDAEAIVRTLALTPHPEGGYFRETHRSPIILRDLPDRTLAGTNRAASTAIYFLLPSGAFSALHRVASEEVWHHYDGDAVELHTIETDGTHACVVLGRSLARGERPQRVVPAGVWQAAVSRGDRFSLCGCTVAPGFDFADFEMPPRPILEALFPQHAALVATLTRGGSGPTDGVR